MEEIDATDLGCADPCHHDVSPNSGIVGKTSITQQLPEKPRCLLGSISPDTVGSSICYTSINFWWHKKFALIESVLHRHHWKLLCSSLLLGLFFLGLKLVVVETDFENLWISRNDRLISEWQYVASALQRTGQHSPYTGQPYSYYGSDARRSRVMFASMGRSRVSSTGPESDPLWSSGSASTHGFSTGLPGHEFSGTMESVIQTTTEPSGHRLSEHSPHILTPATLLDHLEFLMKVRRLQITVGASKWSFKDLCQRATLPFGAEMHHIQAYVDMIIPCLIITPLDCFWEGAKVLGPEEALWIPWFGERTLIQWTNIDPVGLLEDLRDRYGNYSRTEVTALIRLFRTAGIDHGYLNRTCLDPSDPACPRSAPNHRGQPPNVARVLNGGCPGFASKMLHWSEDLIVGGRVYAKDDSAGSPVASRRVRQTREHSRSDSVLVGARSFQSLILLRSPRDLYEAVRITDPYKHDSWTVADAQHVLDEWRRGLRRLVSEHNAGLQSNSFWTFCVLTDSSLRDLLRDLTVRFGPVKLVGCVVLVTLYGLVCLLDWRDPIRSQCWLVLAGLLLITASSIAGLGICAALGWSFNLLTIQVLPFLLMGLGVHTVFTLTTCHHCCVARRITPSRSAHRSNSSSLIPWPSNSSLATHLSISTCSALSDSSSASMRSVPILAEHGPSLLFGTVSVSTAFFCAAYIPIPLMRQFCLQAGTLTLVQSISLVLLFPVLLKLDGIRRAQRRLDVLCCLKQQPTGRVESGASRGFRQHTPSYKLSLGPSQPDECVDRPRRHQSEFFIKPDRSLGGRDPGTNVPRSSIRVKVINHLPGPSDSTSSAATSNPGSSSTSHTIQTTVTVSGTPVEFDAQSSGELYAQTKQESVPRPAVIKKPRVPVQQSVSLPRGKVCTGPSHGSNWSSDSDAPILEQATPTSPPLVQLARRLALLLTKHWTIQLAICIAGLLYLIAIGVITGRGLHLGLDWSTLIPVDAVEYGFMLSSKRDFGLHTFQVIVRGTDLSESMPSPNSLSFFPSPSSLTISNASTVNGFQTRPKLGAAVIGRGVDFPMQQRQLHQLYTRLGRVPGVVLAGQRYWLAAMRDWLQQVQHAFDADRRRGLISDNGHWSSNASELGVLGLQLIVQTDRGPELGRIYTGRLVRNGIVDPPAFYTLFHVWRSYDAINFTALACTIYPEPVGLIPLHLSSSTRSGSPSDLLALPPAGPIDFVQTTFYAKGIRGTQDQLKLVQNVRLLTESMTAQGVPAFPIGDPFTFSENFLYLARETSIALGIFFAIILVVSLILFSSPVTSLLLLVFGAGGGLCAGLCGLWFLGLELNPVSAALLLFCSGWSARLSVGFLGCWPAPHYPPFTAEPEHYSGKVPRPCPSSYSIPGDEETGSVPYPVRANKSLNEHSMANRVVVSRPGLSISRRALRLGSTTGSQVRHQLVRALSNHLATMLHSTVSLILAVSLLVAARVQFIVDHFFWLIVLASLLCLCNSCCVIPTVCCLLHPIQQFITPNATSRYAHGIPVTARRRTTQSIFPRSQILKPLLVQSDEPAPAVCSSSGPTPIRPSPTSACETLTAQSVSPSSSQSAKPSSRLSHRALSSEYTNADLLNLCQQQLRSFPDDYTAALVVAVATAATANTIRSRPASLSTISEEPSHSSSTVSLNRLNPSGRTSGSVHGSSSGSDGTAVVVHNRSTSTDISPAELLHLVRVINLAKPSGSVDRQSNESVPNRLLWPSSIPAQTDTSYVRNSTLTRKTNLTDASPPPSYTSVIQQMPGTFTNQSELSPRQTLSSTSPGDTLHARSCSPRSLRNTSRADQMRPNASGRSHRPRFPVAAAASESPRPPGAPSRSPEANPHTPHDL